MLVCAQFLKNRKLLLAGRNECCYSRATKSPDRQSGAANCSICAAREASRYYVTDFSPATDSRSSCLILFSPPDWSRWFLFSHTRQTARPLWPDKCISSCPVIARSERYSLMFHGLQTAFGTNWTSAWMRSCETQIKAD